MFDADSNIRFILRHLFYSLLISLAMVISLEILRPNFVSSFLNTNWLFATTVVCGIMSLKKS